MCRWGISFQGAQPIFCLPSSPRQSKHRACFCLTAQQVSIWLCRQEWRRSWLGGSHPALRISISILGARGYEPHEHLRGSTLAWEITGNSDFPRPDYWTTVQTVVIYSPLTALFTQPAWMQISIWKRWRRWSVQPARTGDWFYTCSVNTATHDCPHSCSPGREGEHTVPRTLAQSFCLSER